MSAADPPVAHLHPITQGFLNRFASRRKWLLIARGAAAAVLTLLVAATAIVIVDFVAVISDPVRWGLSLVAYAAAILAGIRMGWWRATKPDSFTLAREVQATSPKLKDHLLSAVELAAEPTVPGSTRFRTALQDNIARRVSLLQTQELLPWRLIQKWTIAAIVVVSVAGILMVVPPMQWGRRLARAMLPGISIQRAAITQLEIIAPEPPSRFVAEGDAVSIIASVSRLGDGEVSLQWKDADGNEGVQSLSPRQHPSAMSGSGVTGSATAPVSASDATENSGTARPFAGNITVGSVPVRYRVLAGDAVSLWHELTPLPRPAVVEITKRYVYPEYTGLEPFTQTDPHGDLSAVIGTLAELTVEFDQPVRDAVLRYGLRGRPESMKPVDGSQTQFTARVPIQLPTSYQADAVSIRSELSQPFGPQYHITPIPDSPPMALWGQVPDSQIVSPLAAIELTAIAEDDLPMDRLVQEIQINNDPLITREIEVEGNSRKIEAIWLWDLVDRNGDRQEDTRKLKAGDTLRTRVVAIDRRGIRGESEFIEWLIADEGIDVTQHERLRQVTEVVRKLGDHWREQTALLKFAEDSMGDADAIPDDAWFKQVDQWTESCVEIQSTLKSTVANSPSQYDGVVWSRLANWVHASQLRTVGLISQFKHRRDHLLAGESDDKRDRDERRRLASQSRETRQNIDDLEIVAVGLLGTEMSAARVGDAITLRRSLAPVVDVDRPLPIERFPRYVNLATARLLELSELGSAGADLMPRSATSQMRNFTKWAQTWHARLSNEISELAPERHQQLRNSVRQFENDLRNQIAHSLLDNNLVARMNSSVDKLERRTETIGEPIKRLSRAGASQRTAEAMADEASDIDDVARWRLEAENNNREFDQIKQQWLAMVNDRESLQRKLPQTDLRYAADLNLIRAAITNVTREGYGPYQDETADEALGNIARATTILHAAADLESARRVLAECGEKERSIAYGADAKVRQPNRIEHYLAVAQRPIERFQKSGVDWGLLEAIDATRYNDDANRARTQITSRRWTAGPDAGAVMVRGDGAIGQMMSVYRTRMPGLEPTITEARETIQRYVESLSEQARRAAQSADQAAEQNSETEPRDGPENSEAQDEAQPDDDSTAEQAAIEAERQAAEMIQALIDRANNADVWSEAEKRAEDLEVSRDADAASALIDEARKRAQDAREESTRAGSAEENEVDLAEALRQLRDELERVAEHFENLESGRDASQTRQSLRDDAEQTDAEQEIEPLRQAIEQAADSMNVSPEERLKQLEAELQNDPAMQNELSKISQQAIQAAANRMEQAAEDENEVRRRLEDADPRIQEAKRRIQAELAAMTRTAADVDTALMNRSNQAISAAPPQANDDGPTLQNARDQLQEARRQISEAIAQANSLRANHELVESMKSASAAMAESLRNAAKTAQSLQETTDGLVQKSENAEFKHPEVEKRAEQLRAARSRQMQQVARQSLTDRGRSAGADKDRWREVSRDAFRRVRDAKKQVNDAQKKVRSLEQRRGSAEKRGNLSEVKNLDAQIAKETAREQVAQTAVEAAEKTADIATARSEQASDRQTELQRSALPPLETANPPAELASRLASQAAEQLADLAERAQAISGRIPDSIAPNVTADRAQPIADRQRQITDEVGNAAADLQRASRHERRLDRQPSADALADAAAQVTQQAQPAAQRASEALQNQASDGAGSNSPTPEGAEPKEGAASGPPPESAAEQTKSAEAAIRQTAQILGGSGDLAGQASETGTDDSGSIEPGSKDSGSKDSGTSNPGSPQPSGDPSRSQAGRENAQQLDELDRALYQTPSESAPGDPSDSQASSSPSDPSGKPSQPGQDSPQGSSAAPPSTPTAGQLSPTMAAGMQRKLQSAARQRQQLLDPPETTSGEGEADEQAPDTPPPNASDPSNTAGAGDPPAGGDVNPDRGDALGDDWGSLRARTTDDATGSTLQRVPPAYRKQLEAYFREIARRGGERQP